MFYLGEFNFARPRQRKVRDEEGEKEGRRKVEEGGAAGTGLCPRAERGGEEEKRQDGKGS